MPGIRARLRATLRSLRRSLASRCLVLLAAYALALACLFAGVGALSDSLFNDAFPSMETVLEYEDALAEDRFDALATKRLANCLIAVFDDQGRRLYASSERAAEKILASDVSIISDYVDGSFYEVFDDSSGGELRHRIMLCTYDGSGDNAKVVIDWCVLDEDLNVVEGTLFSDRGSLTEREFGLIRGVYEANMSVSRLEYATSGGAGRTLVLVTPNVSESSYARVTDAAGRLWLLALPVALSVTAVAALLLGRLVRRAARPLDRAIAVCGEGAAPGLRDGLPAADEAGVPTELVPVYEGFRDLMGRLRSSRDDQRRMVASVSHDLKTPLTVIRGYAQALCERRVDGERADAYHRTIYERAIAAAGLLDELSVYVRTEHPDLPLELSLADARALVTAAVEEVRPRAEQTGCALEVELGSQAAPVMADAALFRRMMVNLVGNAFDHNPAGTRVLVRCSVRRSPHGEGEVRILVADTGVGVPAEMAAHVFDPFVTENAARSAGGGTGLGLTIALRAAELMGGTIRLEERPAPPWATEFTATLPLADGLSDPQRSFR